MPGCKAEWVLLFAWAVTPHALSASAAPISSSMIIGWSGTIIRCPLPPPYHMQSSRAETMLAGIILALAGCTQGLAAK